MTTQEPMTAEFECKVLGAMLGVEWHEDVYKGAAGSIDYQWWVVAVAPSGFIFMSEVEAKIKDDQRIAAKSWEELLPKLRTMTRRS